MLKKNAEKIAAFLEEKICKPTYQLCMALLKLLDKIDIVKLQSLKKSRFCHDSEAPS